MNNCDNSSNIGLAPPNPPPAGGEERTGTDLQKTWQDQERKQASTAFSLIRRIHGFTQEPRTVRELGDMVVKTCLKDLAVDGCALIRIDLLQGEAMVMASAGLGEANRSFSVEEGLIEDLREPTFLDDSLPSRPSQQRLRELFALPSLAWCPVDCGKETLFAMYVGRDRAIEPSRMPFSWTTMEMLGALSSAVLLARNNILLMEEHRQEACQGDETIVRCWIEERLRRSERLIDSIAQASPYGICILDLDTPSLVYSNERAKALVGREIELFSQLGAGVFEVILHPDDLPVMRSNLRRLALVKGESIVEETYRLRGPDGSWRWILTSASLFQPLEGQAQQALVIFQDITDRRRLEERIAKAHKMESLGVLAGGIAHDFNNLLMCIMGNAELALYQLDEGTPERENAQEIINATWRASELTKKMLAYSGRGSFILQEVDLGDLIQEMMPEIEANISPRVRLKYCPVEGLPTIKADISQMRQIVMSLLTNASEAIGEGEGVIEVALGVVEASQGLLADTYIEDSLVEGTYTTLEISDDGQGMDRETLERVFDPFFSTKFTGRGLGLAAVLGIVRGHRGAIKVVSEPGGGSRFIVFLPVLDQGQACEEEESLQGLDWQGSGTILLVDDERQVREVVKGILERIGFTVLLAQNGREAISLYKAKTSELSCVLLDLTMPYMDGEATFHELRLIDRTVPIILSSGYSEQEMAQRFEGLELAGMLHKPYLISHLLDILRRILGA